MYYLFPGKVLKKSVIHCPGKTFEIKPWWFWIRGFPNPAAFCSSGITPTNKVIKILSAPH
jgi:hypothetical protein